MPRASGSKIFLRRAVFNKFAKCKQGPFESSYDFRVRFDLKHKVYVDLDNKEKEDEDLAMDFMESLENCVIWGL